MMNINGYQPKPTDEPMSPPPSNPNGEPLVKAHPAAALVKAPGWVCTKCSHKNPVTAAFCERCEVPD